MTDYSDKKILLIKLSSLGDVVFNIPLANALKKNCNKLDWLVSEKGYSVLNNNPCVNNVILAPFVKWGKNNFFEALKEYFSIIKKIRKEKYDIVIDTQGRWKSLIFSLLSGAKRRIAGSDGKEFSKFGANEIVKVPPKGDWSINVVKKYLLYAKHLGINQENIVMSLPSATEECKRHINELLININPKKPIVVLCPVTTWETKHWNKDNWKKLVNKFEDRFNVIFTGTNSDIEYIEYINEGKHLNLAGKTTLLELAELFKKSDLVISLDSGSTHLAAAANAKSIISIYCSTPETYYAPIGKNYVGLAGHLSCHPCHKRKCKFNTNACTMLPEINEVINVINKILNTDIT